MMPEQASCQGETVEIIPGIIWTVALLEPPEPQPVLPAPAPAPVRADAQERSVRAFVVGPAVVGLVVILLEIAAAVPAWMVLLTTLATMVIGLVLLFVGEPDDECGVHAPCTPSRITFTGR